MEKVFTDGMIIKKPRQGAPDFVVASISIKVEDFTKFLENHAKGDGWVNIDVLKSRDGEKWYGALNQWTKDAGSNNSEIQPASEEDIASSIPF